MAPIALNGDDESKLAQLNGLEAAGVAHDIIETSGISADSALRPLDAKQTTTTLSKSLRKIPAPNSPEAQGVKICTDHMLTVEWDHETGWAAPEIKPYGPLSLEPTASVLHYATECFEGMKLFRGEDGKLRLFRPLRNGQRMHMSAARIALPAPDPEQVVELVSRLAAVDGPRWLPRPNECLYVRPTLIGTDAALGVQRPGRALLYVILCMWPSEDRNPNGITLLASAEDTVRAWPGGFGYAKVGASYGPSLATQGEARRRGFTQVLWLMKQDDRIDVTEAGAANFFAIIRRPGDQKVELITPGLESKVILDGVTRNSILQLARDRLAAGKSAELEPLEVVERNLDIREITAAADEGRLIEAFAVGTAFFVSGVSLISYNGRDIVVPARAGSAGEYASLLKRWIGDIMYGREAHEWGQVVPENA